jgi:hypothetical protein
MPGMMEKLQEQMREIVERTDEICVPAQRAHEPVIENSGGVAVLDEPIGRFTVRKV